MSSRDDPETPDLTSPSRRTRSRTRDSRARRSLATTLAEAAEEAKDDSPAASSYSFAQDDEDLVEEQDEQVEVQEPAEDPQPPLPVAPPAQPPQPVAPTVQQVPPIVQLPQPQAPAMAANQPAAAGATAGTGGGQNAPAPAQPSVSIGGVSIPTNATASLTNAGSLVTLKKQDRINLSADKRQELFSRITASSQQSKFELLPQTISSIEDLQGTYDLQLNLQTLETAFMRYDLIDVFTIVFPVKDPVTNALTATLQMEDGSTKTRNLFRDFNVLEPSQVAESSAWYTQWVDASTAPWFRENLSLSFDYLQAHLETDLWGKVMEDLAPYYGTQAQGGPLVFIYMMKRLQVNSRLVVDSL
ncbi:MAG: hypothetical protein ACX936_21460, partial [Marinobacter sp.]